MKRNYQNRQADLKCEAWKADLSKLPFAFTYGGKEYRGFSEKFFETIDCITECKEGKETNRYYFSLCDELRIELLLTHYYSHGVTEWTVWFENPSERDSEILEKVKTRIEFRGKLPVLNGILGDHYNQYRPYAIELTDMRMNFSSDIGRATHINFPYFNLEYGDGGAMLAIGWAGTWRADFISDGETTVYEAASVNGMRTYLKPHEKIRTALFAVAEYTVRSERYATNYWRDWYIKWNLPKANAKGEDLQPFSNACLAYDTGLPNSDGSISERYYTWKPSLEKMLAEDIKVDFRWFDAGWYVRPNGESEETDWWGSVGTWTLDPVKWPNDTFLESTEYARAHGMKTLVWFEPERVTDPENLEKNFGYKKEWAICVPNEKTISNNIGIPECLEWTTAKITDMLKANKVEMYREDNNCNAAALWTHLDGTEGENRKGITECKFIGGHYKMWDDIIACTSSYGGCAFVDSCASGGGRNDLESMRRGVPILRSDSDRTTVCLRLSMTTAFNKWIPFCGANAKETTGEHDMTDGSDPYVWRASYLAILNITELFVHRAKNDFDRTRFGLKEWKRVSPYLLKEFYVLTPWHSQNDITDFTAYCYFDPETEKGAVLAFRQEHCHYRDTLSALLPFAKGRKCVMTDEDSGEKIPVEDGAFKLYFSAPRTAKLLWVELI